MKPTTILQTLLCASVALMLSQCEKPTSPAASAAIGREVT